MSRLVTLSLTQEAYETLKQFAWGEKSKLISEFLETLTPKDQAMKENPELTPNPKIVASPKTSSTSAKPETPSSAQATILQRLFSAKPKTQNTKTTS